MGGPRVRLRLRRHGGTADGRLPSRPGSFPGNYWQGGAKPRGSGCPWVRTRCCEPDPVSISLFRLLVAAFLGRLRSGAAHPAVHARRGHQRAADSRLSWMTRSRNLRRWPVGAPPGCRCRGPPPPRGPLSADHDRVVAGLAVDDVDVAPTLRIAFTTHAPVLDQGVRAHGRRPDRPGVRAASRCRRRRGRRRVRPRCAGAPAGSTVLLVCRQHCLRFHSIAMPRCIRTQIIASI